MVGFTRGVWAFFSLSGNERVERKKKDRKMREKR
jgi:hypothetical protein